MQGYTTVFELCRHTGFFLGYVPGFPGTHTQSETLEELNDYLAEITTMILDNGAPAMRASSPAQMA